MNKLQKFWETSKPKFAHLTDVYDWTTRDRPSLALSMIRWPKNSIVLDYGCGGGWLGVWLLKEQNISKYIAVDIAQRQLDIAEENLHQHRDRCEFVLAGEVDSLPHADIVVCLACLYHMPEYLAYQRALQLIRSTEAKTLLMQWRERDQGPVQFHKQTEYSEKSLLQACWTNSESLLEELQPSQYEISSLTESKIGTVDARKQFDRYGVFTLMSK